jgi:hypothetical protein
MLSLFASIEEGDVGRAMEWVRQDPESLYLEQDGVTPVLLAAYKGQFALAAWLATEKQDCSLAELLAVPFMEIIRQQLNVERIAYLNAHTADGYTPLGLVVHLGHKEPFDYLLELGADPNLGNPRKGNVAPLHSAVNRRDIYMVDQLLGEGANPNQTQWKGITALHQAAYHGLQDIGDRLMQAGAVADKKCDTGLTAADYALKQGHAWRVPVSS